MAYEDFLADYTEVDEKSALTVYQHYVTALILDDDSDAYVYRDMGVGHFGTTFSHLFRVQGVSIISYYPMGAFHALTNRLDDWAYMESQNESAIVTYAKQFSGSDRVRFLEVKDGTPDEYNSGGVPLPTLHYNVERTSDTAIKCEIYSDDGGDPDVLLDTLIQSVPSGEAYRYVGVWWSYDAGDPTDKINGQVHNLDLQEAAASTTTEAPTTTEGPTTQAPTTTEGPTTSTTLGASTTTEAPTTEAPGPTTTAAPTAISLYVNDALCEELLVRSIRASYVRPWEAELFWPGRHDAPPPCGIEMWADVRIEDAEGNVRFRGNVTAVNPGGVDQEGVLYLASGKRFRLENEPVQINGRGAYVWNRRGHVCEEGWGGEDSPGRDGGKWAAGEIILDILEHALGVPPGGSDIDGHHGDDCCVTGTYLTASDIAGYTAAHILALNSIVGEFSVDNTPVAQAVGLLIALNGGYYGWYIDPETGNLEVVDLDALATADLEAGELGHWQDEAGTDYVLLGNALEWSLDGVCSSIVIQGTDRTVEVMPSDIEDSGNPALGDGGELELVAAPWKGWPAAYRPLCQPYRHPTGKEIDGAGTYTPPEGYSSYTHLPRIYEGLGAGAKYVYDPSSGIGPRWMLNGLILFSEEPDPDPGHKLWGWYWARLPFTVTAGPDGDAYHWYGYERTRTVYDGAFRHTMSWPQPGTADDEAAMGVLAGRLLRMVRDVRRQGVFRCDGVGFAEFNLLRRYNLANLGPEYILGPSTTAGPTTTTEMGGFSDPLAWRSLRINAVDVLYDFETESTEITAANTFWMLEEYSELKRRLEQNLFAQRELDLSEDIYACQTQPPYVQPPAVAVNPTGIERTVCVGGSPSPDTLLIWNAGGGHLSYSITDTAAWLNVVPEDGSSYGSEHGTDVVYHSVQYDISGLGVGDYPANIVISSTNATNSPLTVPVLLHVVECPTTTPGGPGITTAAPTTGAPTTEGPPPTTPPGGTTTTSTEGPTTTSTEGPTTTTEAPGCPSGPQPCAHCDDHYSVSLAGIDCGHFVECQDEAILDQVNPETGNCVWQGGSPCHVVLSCADANWHLTFTHGPTGKQCIYERPATPSSCPTGSYSKVSGNCPDCPETMTVY